MTGKADRFITAMSVAGFAWVGFGWVGSGPAAAALVAGGYLHEEDNFREEDDFDALLASSSFGSEQARAIREQAPPAAREHARRVLDGKEKCAPADGDVDDAVGGLVYGLAREVVPGPTVLILAGSSLTPGDLLTAWSGHGQADLKLVIFTACQTSVLWPDHRARLLQALIDHDAFASLRHDVAWKIIDWTFDVPRPPRVLRQCAALAIEQIDISALAYTWLASTRDEAAARSCQPGLSYLHMSRGDAALQDVRPQQETPAGRSDGPEWFDQPALDAAPPRAALTAGPTRQTIAAETDTPAATQHSARRVRAHTRRLPPRRRRTARRRPSAVTARKAACTAAPSAHRLAITVTTAVTVIAAVIGLFLGNLQPGIAHALRPALPSHLQWTSTSELQPFSARARNHNLIAAALPRVLLFASNSAALEPGADAVLQPIAYRARVLDLAVSITGYASPDGGTSAYNLALSARRAEAVRDRLIALGLPAGQVVQVTGVGTAGESRAACFVHGHLDEAACAQLRRVVILLLPAKENR